MSLDMGGVGTLGVPKIALLAIGAGTFKSDCTFMGVKAIHYTLGKLVDVFTPATICCARSSLSNASSC